MATMTPKVSPHILHSPKDEPQLSNIILFQFDNPF
jgi:hypothetical protein